MASSSSSRILFLLLLSLAVASTAAPFHLVGGRKEVPNVESNDDVQDLGLFCVDEYNHRRRRAGVEKLLTFSRVEAAQRQVVSGIKYYLKIAARDGRDRTFDAVVVVKPWLHSRSLLSFTPNVNY